MKRQRYFGNRCYSCGAVCVPTVDNFGERYMGCPFCIVRVLTEQERKATE
jgi:hypothetical protein